MVRRKEEAREYGTLSEEMMSCRMCRVLALFDLNVRFHGVRFEGGKRSVRSRFQLARIWFELREIPIPETAWGFDVL